MSEVCAFSNCDAIQFKCSLCREHFLQVVTEARIGLTSTGNDESPSPFRSALYLFNRIADNVIEGYRNTFKLNRQDLMRMHLEEAHSQLRTGATDRAARALQRAQEIAPLDPRSRLALGDVYLRKGQHEEALRIFEQIEGNGSSTEGLTLRKAHALIGLGRHEEALAYLGMAADEEGENPELHYRLGASLESLGRYEDAVIAFERAAALNECEPRYLQALGFAQEARGEHEHALQCFKRALELER